MGKKLLRMALLAVLMTCLSLPMTAQISVMTEGFESGMPATWTQDTTSGAVAWTVGSSGLTGVTAHGGSNYVSIYTTDMQNETRLITPLISVSSLTSAELSFYSIQEARGAVTNYARDTLRIYVRTSTTAPWTLLQTFSAEKSVWSKESVDLSNYASASLQVAFGFVYGAGKGIGIDDIRIGDASVCFTPNNLTAYRITSNSAQLMWNAYETAYQYGLKVSTSALTDPS
ncbi:MAG: choice-of-anchor J domain-containing protein, partial [Bacteroidales bacterium]|nr:choice-of-anchor J domain-containing protein [Bacteroidales bacterium]